MKSSVVGSIVGGALVIGALIAVGYVYFQNDNPERNQPGVSEEMIEPGSPSGMMDTFDDTTETMPIPTDSEDSLMPMGISQAEVEQNNDTESCWTIVDGKVYDITSYIPRHPGGVGAISSTCGQNGTTLFQSQPSHSSSATQQLESLYIGELE